MSVESAAVVNASVARALIRCAAMQAENQRCAAMGMEPIHNQADFEALIDDEGIGHNNVHGLLYP